MQQFIVLKDETKLKVQSVISLALFPRECIEIKFEKEESFQKLFDIFSKTSEKFDEKNIEEFSVYSVGKNEAEVLLQGTYYGFYKLMSITYDEEGCSIKLEKMSEYDMTINEIKNSIKTEKSDINSRLLELESILFDLMSM